MSADPSGAMPAFDPSASNLSVDLCFMGAALARSEAALGTTAPNPCVGALVVRNGRIVGRGVTRPGGHPHAETTALAQAGPAARGATLYVTLEPCASRSDPRRGPSCTDAILAAGIARVVVATDDPSPMAGGAGYARLAAAGISVSRGICTTAAARLHRGHFMRVLQHRPMITLKLAETRDGYAGSAPGSARLLITGAPAGGRTQEMRAGHDAVMVGIGTVRADDPLLTVRLDQLPPRRPVRIVLDSDLSLPLASRLVRTRSMGPVWAVGATDAPADREAALGAAGIKVVRTGRGDDGGLDLVAALAALADRGMTRVFCEGGPTLATALVAADLVDAAAIFTARRDLAGPGIPALSTVARARLADAAVFAVHPQGWVGHDRLTLYERKLACSPG